MTASPSAQPSESTDTTRMLACESCGMPIETGPYCDHCTDDAGNLQSFDERLRRMMQWQRRSHPADTDEQVRAATLEYLATMPAWREHPQVAAQASAQVAAQGSATSAQGTAQSSATWSQAKNENAI